MTEVFGSNPTLTKHPHQPELHSQTLLTSLSNTHLLSLLGTGAYYLLREKYQRTKKTAPENRGSDLFDT